ncbi:unnamed protein product, partial [Mesorhabditis belari]|uniref:Uncharacterized protein n=1 Tax=Mesorhabditis belari TaxID=2138241 RepID=A0AAF3F465_9BILA
MCSNSRMNTRICQALTLYLLGVLLHVAHSSPLQSDSTQCGVTLKSAGATDKFGTNVGHAIHSITVRALRKFDPSVSVKNRVPTVNLNLSSETVLLSYAPDRRGPSDALFHSDGMKTFDEILSQMDDPTWALKGFSPLEKLVHAFHMEEAWSMTLHQYQKVQQNPPSGDVCRCANDVENNGVMKMLGFVAQALRAEPIETIQENGDPRNRKVKFDYEKLKSWGTSNTNDKKGRISYDYNRQADAQVPVGKKSLSENDKKGRISYNYEKLDEQEAVKPSARDGVKFDYAQQMNQKKAQTNDKKGRISYDYNRQADQAEVGKKSLNENDKKGRISYSYEKLDEQEQADHGEDNSLPLLDNAAAWEVWKPTLITMKAEDHFDTALFLYCALRN